MSQPKTVAQCEAWIADLKQMMKDEGGGGDYRMWNAARLSLRTAERELKEAQAREGK